MLAIPTFFDLIATVLMNIGLLSVTASVYQMMRGAEMLFAALFAVSFLHRSLNRLHLLGILCCVVSSHSHLSFYHDTCFLAAAQFQFVLCLHNISRKGQQCSMPAILQLHAHCNEYGQFRLMHRAQSTFEQVHPPLLLRQCKQHACFTWEVSKCHTARVCVKVPAANSAQWTRT